MQIKLLCMLLEFYYNVWNQRQSFIRPDLIIKNREVPNENYFKGLFVFSFYYFLLASVDLKTEWP
jgi:hypothetical protein